MKIAKLPKWSLWAVGAVIVASVIAIALYATHGKSEPAEKHIVEMSPMWPYVDLDDATERAEFIVYGKVVDISKTKVHEENDSLGNPFREYYKDITLEVIDQIKGSHTNSTVTYMEMGGESDAYIYMLKGYEPLSASDEVILFANKYGGFLAPETLIRVTDGSIAPAKQMLPANLAAAYSDSYSISVSDYLEAVKAKLH